MPLLILLTDGAGMSMSNLSPQEESHRIAEQIKEDNILHRDHQHGTHRLRSGIGVRWRSAWAAPVTRCRS
ncbi:MAG: hypothetical protein U0694_28280 [Anaerolineae bacterium]